MWHLRVTAAKGLLGLADLLETAALHLLPEPTTPVAVRITGDDGVPLWEGTSNGAVADAPELAEDWADHLEDAE